MELLLSWEAPIWVTVTSYDSSAMRLTALLHAVEKKRRRFSSCKNSRFTFACKDRWRTSRSRAKTGQAVHIYIYVLLYPGTPSAQILSISCGIMPLWRLGELILLSSYSGAAGVRVRESRNEGDQPGSATKQVLSSFFLIPCWDCPSQTSSKARTE